MKCDGSQPCSTCECHGKLCEYSNVALRVSTIAARSTPPSEPSVTPDDGTQERPSGQSEFDCIAAYGMDHVAGVGRPDINAATLPAACSSQPLQDLYEDPDLTACPIDGAIVGDSPRNGLDTNMVFDITQQAYLPESWNPFTGPDSFNATTWPLVHENLFLQPNSQELWAESDEVNTLQTAKDAPEDEFIHLETARASLPSSHEGQPQYDDRGSLNHVTIGSTSERLRPRGCNSRGVSDGIIGKYTHNCKVNGC